MGWTGRQKREKETMGEKKTVAPVDLPVINSRHMGIFCEWFTKMINYDHDDLKGRDTAPTPDQTTSTSNHHHAIICKAIGYIFAQNHKKYNYSLTILCFEMCAYQLVLTVMFHV